MSPRRRVPPAPALATPSAGATSREPGGHWHLVPAPQEQEVVERIVKRHGRWFPVVIRRALAAREQLPRSSTGRCAAGASSSAGHGTSIAASHRATPRSSAAAGERRRCPGRETPPAGAHADLTLTAITMRQSDRVHRQPSAGGHGRRLRPRRQSQSPPQAAPQPSITSAVGSGTTTNFRPPGSK